MWLFLDPYSKPLWYFSQFASSFSSVGTADTDFHYTERTMFGTSNVQIINRSGLAPVYPVEFRNVVGLLTKRSILTPPCIWLFEILGNGGNAPPSVLLATFLSIGLKNWQVNWHRFSFPKTNASIAARLLWPSILCAGRYGTCGSHSALPARVHHSSVPQC